MRKNEVKASNDGRHLLRFTVSFREFVSNDTKEHIK